MCPPFMDKCLICRKTKVYPICQKCAKKPFLVERARQISATLNDLESLRRTYNSNFAEIKNLNTASFWNKQMAGKVNLKDQDGMTKDRIRTAFKFLPRTARRILDIGAGHGLVEEFLSKNKEIKLFGNDISSEAIKDLKRKFKGKFVKESVYKMKYKNNFFDAIFMLEVLEHIPPSRLFKVLENVKNILKKNGSLILSVPTNEGLEKQKDNPSGHVRTYTENLIRAELNIAGFEVIRLRTFYAFKNFYTVKKISSKIINRWQPNNIVILAKPV